MLSRIRIGLFALSTLFQLSSFSALAQGRPGPMQVIDSLSQGQITDIVGKLSWTAEKLATELTEMEEKAKETALQMENQLNLVKLDSSIAKGILDSLSRQMKNAKSDLKKISSQQKRASKVALLTSSMTDMDSLNLRKNLPKAWKDLGQLYDEIHPPTPIENIEKEALVSKDIKKEASEKVKQNNPPATKKYNPAADVMLHPPTLPCVIASSSRDEFSGEISRELARSELFRYTNPALKTYLQGKTHVICEAALASTGAKATLLLTFNINDPNARKAFGRMEKNSFATLKFLDGSTFELQNSIADDGVFSPDNEASIFRAQYPLNPEAMKKIRRNGLDRIRILWSKGFDDYDVQQVDLLMRQAECLFK